jgi:hypothetical protein
MNPIGRCLVGLLLTAALAGTANAQSTYRIKLDRIAKVGDTYHIDASCTTRQHRVISREGSVVDEVDSSSTIVLNADARVTAVDGTTLHPEITYTINQCLRIDRSDTTLLAAPREQLFYNWSRERPNLTVKNNRIDPEVLDEIDNAIITDNVGTDMEFGTSRPQPVGGRWKVNSLGMARDISAIGSVDIDSSKMQGQASLLSVSLYEGIPVMHVEMHSSIHDVSLAVLKDMDVRKSEAVMAFGGDYPIDEAKRPINLSTRTDVNIDARLHPKPNQPDIGIVMEFTREVVNHFRPRNK